MAPKVNQPSPSTATGGDGAYTGKADAYVPIFSGQQTDYREFRRRCDLYEAKMKLASREKETVFNIVTLLQGRAWDLIEDMGVDDLKAEGSYQAVLKRLDAAFKYEPLTELPNDFEAFFVKLQRRQGQTLQDYAQDFQYAERRLTATHKVNLPEKVRAWWYLRTSGITREQRQLVMTQLGEDGLTLEKTMKAMNFILGQDTKFESTGARWNRGSTELRTAYYAGDYDEEEIEDEAYWEQDDEPWDEDEAYYAGGEDDATYQETEENFDPEEYDEIFSAYVDAKSHLNKMRTSRGFYPVVAMVQGPQAPRQFSRPQGKGKSKGGSKGKKVKGKSKGHGGGKGSTVRQRGRDALGNIICLRCGTAGHLAKNCPRDSGAGGDKKRKVGDGGEDSSIMMAENFDMSEDDDDSDSDDVAVQDQGAASVLGSKRQVRKYLKCLLECGVDLEAEVSIYQCSKGFRFGNSQREVTNVCCLFPVYIGGKKRRILCYVIDGEAPILIGRPMLERLGMAVDFANQKVRYGKDLEWQPATFGKKGEYIIRLTQNIGTCREEQPHEILMPQDFEDHIDIYHKLPLSVLTKSGPLDQHMSSPATEMDSTDNFLADINGMNEEVSHNVSQPGHARFVQFDVQERGESEEKTEDAEEAATPSPTSRASDDQNRAGNSMTRDSRQNSVESGSSEEMEPEPVPSASPSLKLEGMLPTPSPQRPDSPLSDSPESVGEMRKLQPSHMRTMIYEAARMKKDQEVMLAEASRPREKVYLIWEVYAGRGRITQRIETMRVGGANIKGEKFSLATGWDFSKKSDQLKFLRRLRDEEPDEVFLSPECRLWSMLQELSASRSDQARQDLIAKRQDDHDVHLNFVATVYRHQQRNHRNAHIEHPWTSRAWRTKAFRNLKGMQTYVDQCALGLKMENDHGKILPVKKPTCIFTSKYYLNEKMRPFQCSGDHQHTPLEGGIKGRGSRSKIAENYPEKMAAIIAECLAHQPTEDEILAAEEAEIAEPEEAGEGEREEPLQPMEDEDTEVIKANRELRKQVGSRPVDYVARLHKNLGHPSPEVLIQMLKEVQATEDVILAAKHYLCKGCYHRKKPGQAPPAAGISSTTFNHRLQVDSSWIQVAEGRRCILTICDEATRFVALRLLKSERSTEFIKGVERAWIRHFGMPKIIRVDSAKGWSATAIREWTSEKGIALEVSPAEAHSWLAAVERKHQVTRRALELYMEDIGSITNKGLEEACIYVPPRINQLSWTRGFSPYQWVIGKTPQQDLSLTSELYNPGVDPDDATAFVKTQEKRMKAACAFMKADSDAKLRRAMNQKYMELKDEIRLGQSCYYWRIQGTGHLKKNKWRGPAVCIAHETSNDTGKVVVLWLVHGTSLLRCAPQHVRPAVEDANVQIAHNPGAALKALEDLRARSTTQFRDMLSKQRGAKDMVMEEMIEEYAEEDFQQLGGDPGVIPDFEDERDYSPSIARDDPRLQEMQDEFDRIAQDEQRLRDEEEGVAVFNKGTMPGIVSFMIPQLHDRERTPRRTERTATPTTTRTEEIPLHRGQDDVPEAEGESPRKKIRSAGSKKARTGASASSTPLQPQPAEVPELPARPEAEDDELMVEDVWFVNTTEGNFPTGWVCVDNMFEIDEVWLAAENVRRGEVVERRLNVEEREQFIQAKMKELQTFFSNSVWEFAAPEFVEKNRARMITARWVLTWKWDETTNRPKAKARLVLRGFEDPDLFGLEKSSPTAGRGGKMWILCMAAIHKWQVICGDVRAAFLSGAGFTREIVVKLPRDCNLRRGLL